MWINSFWKPQHKKVNVYRNKANNQSHNPIIFKNSQSHVNFISSYKGVKWFVGENNFHISSKSGAILERDQDIFRTDKQSSMKLIKSFLFGEDFLIYQSSMQSKIVSLILRNLKNSRTTLFSKVPHWCLRFGLLAIKCA